MQGKHKLKYTIKTGYLILTWSGEALYENRTWHTTLSMEGHIKFKCAVPLTSLMKKVFFVLHIIKVYKKFCLIFQKIGQRLQGWIIELLIINRFVFTSAVCKNSSLDLLKLNAYIVCLKNLCAKKNWRVNKEENQPPAPHTHCLGCCKSSHFYKSFILKNQDISFILDQKKVFRVPFSIGNFTLKMGGQI